MKQTAVEWLEDEMLKGNFNLINIIKQAKEIESKQQKFSEEEVNNLISDILYEVGYNYSDIDTIENSIIKLFEQFKNK